MDGNSTEEEKEILEKKAEDIISRSDISQEDKRFLSEVLSGSGELFLAVFLGLFAEDSSRLPAFIVDLRSKLALMS